MNIRLEEKAKKVLDLLKLKNNKDLPSIKKCLIELKNNWLNTSWIKNIWDSIYRKRIWRWRILFTIDDKLITVWIIKIEKDTKKDYNTWKKYILNRYKLGLKK